MKKNFFLFLIILFQYACTEKGQHISENSDSTADTLLVEKKPFSIDDIRIEKELLYDQYTLEDVYPYKDTVRIFQWDKIKQRLFLLDSIQQESSFWAILQNYRNMNGEAPLVKKYSRDAYRRIADTLGIERYQAVPLFFVNDTAVAERYGRDGTPVKLLAHIGSFVKVRTVSFEGEWLIPQKYVKEIGDTILYKHAIVVDVTNQNIVTLEKKDSTWFVRSMNPATTGIHNPPYAQETPIGMFVLQEKKFKMLFLKDGTTLTGGFAPYANRFTNGGYIHGIPVNTPRKNFIEYSATLGTTPRSHMCVRNATSHAKFIYDQAPALESIIFVID